ncbi:1-acyl-sn-glycerol-3-phosphate acyltransferase [Aliifodinibius sp. S!AR15-10]|uniref:lysophospholipid acyltransferase family protein n=1 Tax=Aliifodinibius sp. S!AR15-10 TaxID=2950437 RepID=UPI00285D9ADC|nr:lysophospholipid acyltransferase family protein [Aliifodinibius sp. S!AR15-10]MDR8392000.1 1-acyl-sn-glycerol-3-phosphate acyltransferase [Aliifodinibius sp. S!AR15-10]
MDRSELTFGDTVRSLAGIIVFFIVFLVATPVIVLLLVVSFGRLTNFLMEQVGPLMMKPVFVVSGIDFKIQQHSEPINRPAVYLVNHSSTVDLLTIIALGLPRVRFVAKWELQYNPLFFIVGRGTGQIFIKRQDSEKAVNTLQKAYRRIKKRELSILMAPEGSRKHPGIIGPFKKGPFHMAVDLGYPIVPIYFEGNRELSAGGSLFTKSGKVTAHIHPAIYTSEWSKKSLDQHIIDVRSLYLEWAEVENDNVRPIA